MALTRYGNIGRQEYFNTVAQDPDAIGNPAAGTYFEGVFNDLRWTKLSDGTIKWQIPGEPESYQWFSDTDPETIGTPSTGTYYQGVFNGKRWTKDDAGNITFSASGLWIIFDITDNVFIHDVEWIDGLVRWTGTADGLLTLEGVGDNAPVGWHTAIYNDTENFNLEIDIGGTDTIKSHNNFLYVPAHSYAQIGVLAKNGNTEWYASIEQTPYAGIGSVAQGAAGINLAVTANVWTQLVMTLPTVGTLSNVTHPGDGRLVISYADQGTNGVSAIISGQASMQIPLANMTLELAFGINGTVTTGTELVRQLASTGAAQTIDMSFPYSMSFSGFLANGDEISLYVRSSETTTIPISTASLQLVTEAFIGVDLVP